MTAARLHVVAAVLQRDKRYLLQQRQPGKHMAGYWEFPGGKVEQGEAAWHALCRELKEELGISALKGEPLIQLNHAYPDREVMLDVWRVTDWDGEIEAIEHQNMDWCSIEESRQMQLLPADFPVLNAMSLPHRLFVTPDNVLCEEVFLDRLDQIVEHNQLKACLFRQNGLSCEQYVQLTERAAEILKSHRCELILHAKSAGRLDTCLELCKRLGVERIHLPARVADAMVHLPEASVSWSVSCHNTHELRKAADLGVDFVLLGTVLSSPSHPNGDQLGWSRFRELVATINMPVYAIGGLFEKDVVRSRLEGAQGIAAISAWWNKN